MASLRWLAFIGVLSFIIGCGKEKPTESEQHKPVESPKPAEPQGNGAPALTGPKATDGVDFKLTAAELEAEQKKDRKAAEAKYKGKTIELSGTVRSTGPIYYAPGSSIDLDSAERGGPGVLCTTKDLVPPGTLARGQTVRVRGMGSSGPSLVDCVVIERGPDTAIRTTAEQVAKDTTGDPGQATTKYERRTLVLKGKVAAIKTDPNIPAIKYLELKGDGKTVVECRFGSSDQEAKIRDGYKVGDTAVFACELTRADKGVFIVGPCYPVAEKK